MKAKMNLKDKPSQLISIKSTDGEHHVMPADQIVYIERVKNQNNCKVRFFNHCFFTIETRIPLCDFEEVLPNQFVKINRSMLVNIRHVFSYNDDYVSIWNYHEPRTGNIELTKMLPLTFDISHKFVEL